MLIVDTACIHNKLRGKWYVFDDSRVSPCDDTSVVVSTQNLSIANFSSGPFGLYSVV
jgi:hypothetical protein